MVIRDHDHRSLKPTSIVCLPQQLHSNKIGRIMIIIYASQSNEAITTY